jgi:hypothetical protein
MLIKIIKILAFISFLSFIYNKTFDRNYFNYDSVPYVASSYMLLGYDLDRSHAYAWNLLKEKAHPSVFNNLCCATSYRKSMSSNSEAFGSHLSSYRTKSLYIYLIRLVSDFLKIDEFSSLKWISFSSVVILTLISCIFFFNAKLMIYFCIFPILFLIQIIPISRLLTPDSLNALVFLGACFSFLKNKKMLGYLLLLGSILLRQTNIIFYLAFILLELREKKFIKFFGMSALGLALYWFNSEYFESIGYWSTYVSSLIKLPDTFIGFDPAFDASIFFKTLVAKIDWMLGDSNLNRLLSLIFINLLVCLYFFNHGSKEVSENALIPLIFISCSIISYLLIPFPDFRIYSGHLIASSLALLFCLTKQIAPKS